MSDVVFLAQLYIIMVHKGAHTCKGSEVHSGPK